MLKFPRKSRLISEKGESACLKCGKMPDGTGDHLSCSIEEFVRERALTKATTPKDQAARKRRYAHRMRDGFVRKQVLDKLAWQINKIECTWREAGHMPGNSKTYLYMKKGVGRPWKLSRALTVWKNE